MTVEKLSADLRGRLAEAGDEAFLDVVVELEHDTAPAGSMPEAKRAFVERVRPIESVINDAGGEVLGAAWINSTVRARVPAAHLQRLTGLDSVAGVGVPRRLKLD